MKRLCLLFFCFSLLIVPLCAKGNREGSRTSRSPYIGDGGKNISITINVPTAERLSSPSLSNIHELAYRRLLDNFRNYSDMYVRPDLNFDRSADKEFLESGRYDDMDEAQDIAHMRSTNYLMTGTISQVPSGYRFHLQVVNTAGNDRSVAFSYEAPCTISNLFDLSIVNRASLDLLEQMGVRLTESARTELAGAYAANRDKAKTVMREAVAAQEAGDTAKARSLLNQAAELDAQLAQEAQRRLAEMDKPLAMLSTETIPPPAPLPRPQLEDFVPTPERQAPPPAKRTGNLGNDARARQRAYEIEQENERIRQEVDAENERIWAENVRRQEEVAAENARRQAEVDAENARRQAAVDAENAARDAHNREIWVKALADSEEYYRNYLAAVWPIELVYENKIDEMPETQDFEKKTLSVKFNVALIPVESGWTRAVENDVNNLRSRLLATGRAEAWGLANWPQTPVKGPSPFVDRSENITAEAQLLDAGGKILGFQTFFLDWNLTTSFSAKGLSINLNEAGLSSESVLFENINIYDITDTLQIRIARINGEDAEKTAAAGGIQYGTDYQRWKLLERRQHRQAAAKARQEARQAASDKFWGNAGINLMGWGSPGGGGRGFSSAGVGGGEIELRMFHWVGLQTGIYAVNVTEEEEYKTITQIPVLARLNLMTTEKWRRETGNVMWYLSPYAGMDFIFSSSSPVSPIVGFEVGMNGVSLSFFGGGRLQKNVFSDNYGFMAYIGMGYYFPFRKR